MAVRGRKPKPVEQKRVRGNPGHRPLPPASGPDFSAGDGLAPPRRWPRSPGYERAEWGRIVPELQRCGIAKAVHQGLLEKICELYAASAALFDAGHYTSARHQAAEYRRALAEFGLTAASAARVGFLGGGSGTPAGQSDPADEYFGPRLAQ